MITTDASTKGLGATLWQEQLDGTLKPIGYASRFLSSTEKKYAMNELGLLAVVWGLEHCRLYLNGTPIKLSMDHQAFESLIKRNPFNKTYSTRLTLWLDRLSHFAINVNHIASKHLALTDYLSRKPVSPSQTDGAYDEEYVPNTIALATTLINQNTERRKANAKETKSRGQTTHANKLPLIAFTATHTHA